MTTIRLPSARLPRVIRTLVAYCILVIALLGALLSGCLPNYTWNLPPDTGIVSDSAGMGDAGDTGRGLDTGVQADADAAGLDVVDITDVTDVVDIVDVAEPEDAVDAPSDAVVLPPVPRLIAPLSTATVTSHLPTFHWQPAAGSTSTKVQICSDRACAHPVQSFAAAGSSGRPTTNLTAGVYYWRASVAGVAPFSATWEFWVGARSAPVDTSWGTTLDVNGDGFADVAVGADGVSSNTGSVYVYLGATNGLAAAPATTLVGPDGAGGQFGNVLASAGDVNGDGFADVVVAATGAGGNLYVYLGGAGGLTSTAASMNVAAGYAVASAGDVNGDGYADVVVGAINVARVYLGSAAGLAASPISTLRDPNGTPDGANPFFGASVAGAGDVNGDGYADVIVGATGENVAAGAAYVYLGGASGLAPSPLSMLAGPDGANGEFGNSVASAGDMNGDGYADIVVGAEFAPHTTQNGPGRAYVYLGGASAPGPSATSTLAGPEGMGGLFGVSVASAGDVNGDGYSDLVVGASGGLAQTSHAYVYFGSTLPLATNPATTLTGPSDSSFVSTGFANSVAGAGDTNGDGYADIVIGSEGVAGTAGSLVGDALVFVGSSIGVPATAMLTLVGPGGAGGYFGVTVASLGYGELAQSAGRWRRASCGRAR